MRERSPGIWELTVELDPDPLTGRRRRLSRHVRGTKKVAVAKLSELRSQATSGRIGSSSGSTMADLLDRWLELVEADLSPTTVREYRRLIRTKIVPAIGRLPVDRVQAADLDRFYRALVKQGGLSPASVRQIHAVTRRALRQAVKWGWIAANPAVNTTPPRLVKSEIVPPKIAELRRLLAAADDTSPALGMFLRLAASTGMRRGELCGLRWSDLDEVTGVLWVRRAVVPVPGGVVEKTTKTHASRRVTLDARSLEALLAHRGRAEALLAECQLALPSDAYVFSYDVLGTRSWHPDTATAQFRRLATALGLEGVRLHDLRHAHATELLAAGVPIKTVSGRLGHANAATTLSVYAHVLEASDQDAALITGRLLDC